MNIFSYLTVDKVLLTEFSSLEQTKVSTYFHSHKTCLVMELLRFASRYFFQIYSIHAHIKGRIPCIYALLPNITGETYTIIIIIIMII